MVIDDWLLSQMFNQNNCLKKYAHFKGLLWIYIEWSHFPMNLYFYKLARENNKSISLMTLPVADLYIFRSIKPSV